MNISPTKYSPSSADANALGLQASAKQRRQEFEKLDQALQSGDLVTAKKAVTSLKDAQNDSSKAPLNRPAPPREVQVAKALENVEKAVDSGNVPEARSAVVELKQYLRPDKGPEPDRASARAGSAQNEQEVVKEELRVNVPIPVPELSAKDKKIGTVLNALA